MSATTANSTFATDFDDPGLPEIESEPLGACTLCGQRDLTDFAHGFDYELRTCRNRWVFRECAACSHVQLDPRPTPRTLGIIYPPHYYSYNMEEQVGALAMKGKEILDRLKFSSILRSLARKPQSFVDVGCGDGRYLRLLEKLHELPRDRLYGLELSERTVDRLRESGYNAHCERVETCTAIASASIDLVTMFHVIEHVADPVAVTRKIADWLAPGGVFAMETPNLNALDARLFKSTYWGGYHIPRHWHLFRERTLSALLRGAGLEVVAVRYQTGHSFWMYSFHHLLRYRFGLVRLSRWFDPLRGLPFLIAFTGFDKLRAALGFRTSAMLIIARKPA